MLDRPEASASRGSPRRARVGCGTCDGPAHDPLHRQGRRRQDVRRRGHRTALRGGRAAHDRALDRPGALARGRAGGGGRRRRRTPSDGLWAQQVSAQDELQRHWSAVRAWLARVLVDRGVDRIAAEELTVPPGGDELFSLLELKRQATPRSGTSSWWTARRPARRCGCCRSRRRRAGGWASCSAGVPAARRRAAARARLPRRVAARRGGPRRGAAARGEPRGHARPAARPRARCPCGS